MNGLVKVQRDGPRGWHLIDKAKYDANPGAYVLVGEDGKPIEAAKPAPDGLEAKTVKELQALAAEKGIDLGEATKKADIIAAIEAAKPADQQ
jgi:hypothetical protein